MRRIPRGPTTLCYVTDKAEILRSLHRGPDILVLPNAWDAISGRIFESEGFPAIATTSAGVANALGYSDGGAVPPREMFEAVARITRAVKVPVTADIEHAYGSTPSAVADNVLRVIAAGAVGINIEDIVPGATDHNGNHRPDYTDTGDWFYSEPTINQQAMFLRTMTALFLASGGVVEPPSDPPPPPPPPPAEPTLHVERIDTALIKKGTSRVQGRCDVIVDDAAGAPVSGVTVAGHWSGAATDTFSVTTDSSGKATDYSNAASAPSGSSFTCVVDAIAKSGWATGTNTQTSSTVTVP